MTTMTLTPTTASKIEDYFRELEDARMMLGAALSERGEDYVYVKQGEGIGCMYLEYEVPDMRECPTGPSCIVGHVFVNKGIPMDQIRPHEGQMARSVAPKLGAYGHGAIHEALSEAQDAQDDGCSWAEAVAFFEREITKYEEICLMLGREIGAL